MVSQEDWKKIEEKLKSFYSIVTLNCDGYKVTLFLKRIDQFKNAIAIYVNGVVKGKWQIESCEESRRFLRPVTKSVFSPAQKAAIKKLRKKERDQWLEKSKYTYYAADWTSFRSLKKHLIANNKEITLEPYKAEESYGFYELATTGGRKDE